MLTTHHVVAFAVLVVTWGAGIWALVTYRRRREPGGVLRQLLVLAQTALVAQVGVGLVLLSKDYRAADKLHYAYGTFALLAVLSPWLYAPDDPRRRLLWFGGTAVLAAALAVRAFMTA